MKTLSYFVKFDEINTRESVYDGINMFWTFNSFETDEGVYFDIYLSDSEYEILMEKAHGELSQHS